MVIKKPNKEMLDNFEKNILYLIRDHILEIEGIYLIGSYARGEWESDSDIDVLVITERTTKKIAYKKYSIKLVSMEKIMDYLENNAAKIYTMIYESIPLMNSHLIEALKKYKLTKKSILSYIPELKKIVDDNAEIYSSKKIKDKKDSAIALDFLMKRLREIFFIEDMLNRKINYSRKEFINWICKESDFSREEYDQIIEAFYRTKRNKPLKKMIKPELISKLHKFLIYQIEKYNKLRNKHLR